MTKNKILKMLEQAEFYMPFVVDCGQDYLEIFTGDALDYDGNAWFRDQAMKITRMGNYASIAYGGWMISSQPFNIDADNNQ